MKYAKNKAVVNPDRYTPSARLLEADCLIAYGRSWLVGIYLTTTRTIRHKELMRDRLLLISYFVPMFTDCVMKLK